MKFYVEQWSPEDAEELPESEWITDPETFAEEAAEYCHSRHDGWEWSWPVEFTVILDNGEERKFSVDREARPEFRASSIS